MNGTRPRRKAFQGNSQCKTEENKVSHVESTHRRSDNLYGDENVDTSFVTSNSMYSKSKERYEQRKAQWFKRQNNRVVASSGLEENSCNIPVSKEGNSSISNQHFILNDGGATSLNVIVNDLDSNVDTDITLSTQHLNRLISDMDSDDGVTLLLNGQLSHSMRSSTSSMERSSSSSSLPSLVSSENENDTSNDTSNDSDTSTSNDSDESEICDDTKSDASCPPLVSSGDELDVSDVIDSSTDSSETSEEDGLPWFNYHEDRDEDEEDYPGIAFNPFHFTGGTTFSDFVNQRLQQMENGFNPDSHPLLFQFLVEMFANSVMLADHQRNPDPVPPHVVEALPREKIIQSRVDANDTCCICCTEFKLNEEILKLHCSHIYHIDCIKQWLMLRPTCPTCRRDVSEKSHPGQDLPETAV